MPVYQMIKKLNHLKPLSIAFRNYIVLHAATCSYARGEQINFRLGAGGLFFYLVSGTVRGIHLRDGKKTTIWFSTPDHFIFPPFKTSKHQFLTEIEFLTHSLVIPLNFTVMVQALETFPEASILFTRVIAEQLDEANFRELLLRMTYRDRFFTSLKQFPFLLTGCPADIWASYLDISLSALMRIKNREAKYGSDSVK